MVIYNIWKILWKSCFFHGDNDSYGQTSFGFFQNFFVTINLGPWSNPGLLGLSNNLLVYLRLRLKGREKKSVLLSWFLDILIGKVPQNQGPLKAPDKYIFSRILVPPWRTRKVWDKVLHYVWKFTLNLIFRMKQRYFWQIIFNKPQKIEQNFCLFNP